MQLLALHFLQNLPSPVDECRRASIVVEPSADVAAPLAVEVFAPVEFTFDGCMIHEEISLEQSRSEYPDYPHPVECPMEMVQPFTIQRLIERKPDPGMPRHFAWFARDAIIVCPAPDKPYRCVVEGAIRVRL